MHGYTFVDIVTFPFKIMHVPRICLVARVCFPASVLLVTVGPCQMYLRYISGPSAHVTFHQQFLLRSSFDVHKHVLVHMYKLEQKQNFHIGYA